jgi:hypothetical protein
MAKGLSLARVLLALLLAVWLALMLGGGLLFPAICSAIESCRPEPVAPTR